MRLPVASCEIKMDPLCPAAMLLGLAIVRLPPRVTAKLQPASRSGVIVAPSVNVTMVAVALATVTRPDAPSTMLFPLALGFLRLVVESVLIGSLVKDVDRPRVKGVCAVHSGDANAV